MTARIDVELAGARTTITIEPDASGARRALAHVAGCAIAHVGAVPAGPLGAWVTGLGAALRGARDRDAIVDAIVAHARAAGGRAARAPVISLPRWSSRLRTGPSTPDALWPFDPELAALTLGARALIKRECFSAAAAVDDRAWLEAAGLTVVDVGDVAADGRRVHLAARGAIDDEAIAAERAIQRGRDAAAARALGLRLGYPACCIERFIAHAGHDDPALLAALPSTPRAPASPLTQWLSQPLALIAHVPCELTCASTLALAAQVLAALDAQAPGFAARWRTLAARLHVIDHRGRDLALAGTGDLTAGFTITDAIELVVAPDDALGPVAVAVPDAVGRTITAADVRAAADHRA